MTAVYNEIEPYAVRWLENLIAGGHIAPGRVDARSIRELTATDVAGVGQRHFFAGIAGWSVGLRRAHVSDDSSVWTGSCPCQSLSVAGLQRGADDPRHLWPTWYELIAECLPPVVLGEQVAGPAGLAWFTAVRTDLEARGYRVGAACLTAAGVGAPHIRERVVFGAVHLADANGERRDRLDALLLGRRSLQDRAQAAGHGDPCGMANGDGTGPQGWRQRGNGSGLGATRPGGVVGGMANAESGGAPAAQQCRQRHGALGTGDDGSRMGDADRGHGGRDGRGLPAAEGGDRSLRRSDRGPRSASDDLARGPWDDAEWLLCRDGKARPAQPGSFPLAHGVPARVGKLRAYGNAVVTEVVAEFTAAFLDAVADELGMGERRAA